MAVIMRMLMGVIVRVAVTVPMVVIMSVIMAVIVFVLMGVAMGVRVAVARRGRGVVLQIHDKAGGAHGVARDAFGGQRVAVQGKLGQALLECLQGEARVDEGADRHVAADA